MGKTESERPYVVSADSYELMNRWAVTHGYRVPSRNYFADYDIELEAALRLATAAEVDIVDHRELKEGLSSLVANSKYPVISLDRAYLDDDPHVFAHIDVTRGVDPDLNEIGFYHRPEKNTLLEQLELLRTNEISPVVLADDVIFSGDSLIRLASDLARHGRPVVGILAGIGIKSGVDAIQETGIGVSCVRYYEAVTDEVCQRDFLAATPYSGRTVVDLDQHITWSAPYFRPLGNPEKWASIPALRVASFSRFCLEQSINLWAETAVQSGVELPAASAPRLLRGMDNRFEPVTQFLRELRKASELTTVGEED